MAPPNRRWWSTLADDLYATALITAIYPLMIFGVFLIVKEVMH